MKNRNIDFGVLIVDDDSSSLDSLYRSLVRLEYHVYRCSQPALAQGMIKPFRIRMLLTDIRMPVLNGFELSRQLLNIHPDLIIYGYTGFYRESYEQEAVYSGIRQILLKPLDIRELDELIQQELSNSQVIEPIETLKKEIL